MPDVRIDPIIAAAAKFSPIEFRSALGRYASGVTIITAEGPDGPVGFTCQSFHSVSVEPPLVLFGVMKTSTTYPRIRSIGHFAINVLSSAQVTLSGQFARSGTDKWNGVEYSLSEHSNPHLADSLLVLDCSIEAEYEAGDHYLIVATVHDVGLGAEHHSPLLFFKGAYGDLQSPAERS